MNEQQKFRQAFSHLHASADTLQEVINMTNKTTKASESTRRIIILAAALALLASMTLVACGTGFLSDIIAILSPSENVGPVLEDIYGDEISSDTPYMEDFQGNPIARPDMERIALDAQAAEDMVGAYVSTVEGTFTVGNNTFSLCTFMIDEMGMGAFTWTAENPNGIYYKNIGYGMVDFGPASPFPDPTLTHYANDTGKFCDTFTFLIKDENNGKKLHLVTYFGTTAGFATGDILTWRVRDVSVQILPVNCMPTQKFTEENGMAVYASYQGLILKAQSETEIVPHKMVILFADGTQYNLMDEGIYNLSGAVWRKNGTTAYDQMLVLFNRLIDPDEITCVVLEYTWRETVEQNGSYDSILHTENRTFYP